MQIGTEPMSYDGQIAWTALLDNLRGGISWLFGGVLAVALIVGGLLVVLAGLRRLLELLVERLGVVVVHQLDRFARLVDQLRMSRAVGLNIQRRIIDGMGERLVRVTLRMLDDPETRDQLAEMVKDGAGASRATASMREFLEAEVVDRAAVLLGVPDARMRVTLATSYLLGIATTRSGKRNGAPLEISAKAEPRRRSNHRLT